MAKLTTAEFIEAIKELSVLELNDLVSMRRRIRRICSSWRSSCSSWRRRRGRGREDRV